MLKKILILAVMFMVMIIPVGCNSQNAEGVKDDKLTVAVSIVPQESFVKAVAGDLINVVTMIPPGNSPANYQPTPRQMEDLSKSALYFAIGVPTEEANILPEIKDFNKDIQIINLSERVEEFYPHRYFGDHEDADNEHEDEDEDEHESNHHHKGRDPHIWLSPKRVIIMVESIAENLSQIDSDNKDTYFENARLYIEKLNALDKEIKETLQGSEANTFLVYHPAFGYFADDYGLEMITVEVEGKEATVKELLYVIRIAKAKGIKVVFYQAEVDSKQSKSLAEEIGGKVEMVEPLAPDYIENLKRIANTFKNIL